MGFRDGLLRWTMPAGRWGGTAVRASALLPLAAVAATLRAQDLTVGAAVFVGLGATAALSEAVRCAVCARLGSPVKEVVLWPFGGLEPSESAPARPPWVHLLVPATAAAVAAAVWGVCRAAGAAVRFEPDPTPAGVLVLCAAVVAGANLLPAWPLAAGRAVRDLWSRRAGPHAADAAAAGLTHLIGVLWLLLALAVGSAWVAVGAATVMFAARNRRPRPRPARRRSEDDTFLGYDFSAGYTSLERGDEEDDADGRSLAASRGEEDEEEDLNDGDPRPGGSLAAWRRRREAVRRQRERAERLREEEEVDRLLRKISAEGEGTLTTAERRTLTRAAARLRQAPADE